MKTARQQTQLQLDAIFALSRIQREPSLSVHDSVQYTRSKHLFQHALDIRN